MLSRTEVEKIKKSYTKGVRIELIFMDDKIHPVPAGTLGYVKYVDDAGQIHMNWDNGRTIPIIEGVDRFKKVK